MLFETKRWLVVLLAGPSKRYGPVGISNHGASPVTLASARYDNESAWGPKLSAS